VESLKQYARSYRADAVIGFSVNIDELSGKGIPIAYDHRYRYTCIAQHIQVESVGGDIDGSVIKNKVKASLIIERYTGIYTMDNATAEFIATSRLTEFLPLLFKGKNETGEDQVFFGQLRSFHLFSSYLELVIHL
jgi:hypothetical protein